MQELVTSIRNLRAELNLSPSVKCDLIVACENERYLNYINELSPYIKSLAKVGELNYHLKTELNTNNIKAITSVVGPFQVYVKIEGLLDVEQEKQRLDKEIKRTESFLISIEKKLNNEKFVSNAAPQIVENERKKCEDSKQKLEKLKEHYKQLTD